MAERWDAIEQYSGLLDAVEHIAASRNTVSPESQALRDGVRRVLPLFRSARVFAVPAALHDEARAQSDMTLPALPFDSVLIVYPGGCPMLRRHQAPGASHAERLGALVTADGEVWQCDAAMRVDGDPESGWLMAVEPVRSPATGWSKQAVKTEDDRAIPGILRTINAYQTVIDPVSRRQMKRAVRRSKTARRVPPALYPLTLKHRIVAPQDASEPVERAPQRHRSDVRGHYRLRVVRGDLPISDKRRRELAEKGYRLLAGPVVGDDAQRLLSRGIRLPRLGEWAAVKTTWVRAYVRGPEGAPHVPAMRVVPTGKQGDTVSPN